MDINEIAGEILTRASMLLEERKGDELCIEDILYALLSLAAEKDSAEAAWREELNELYALLVKELGRLSYVKTQIEKRAKSGSAGFSPAGTMLGRAMELAGDGQITSLILARAALDIGSPVLEDILSATVVEDSVPEPEPSVNTGNIIFNSLGDDSNDILDDPTVFDVDDDRTVFDSNSLVQEPPVDNTHKPDSEEPAPGNDEAVMRELLKLIEQENKASPPPPSPPPVPPSPPPVTPPSGKAGRTKLGLFSYRGGNVASAIKYYLWGLFVPAALLMGLEALTGMLSAPANDYLKYLGDALIILWAFYLLRGVNLLIRRKNKYLGLFLNILHDILLSASLLADASTVFYNGVDPTWVKITLFAVTVLLLNVGAKVMDALEDNEDYVIETILFRKRVEGTCSKLMLAYALRLLQLPALVCFPLWIFNITLKSWIMNTLLIIGYCILWIYFFNLWDCVGKRAELPAVRYTARKRLMKFLENMHLTMGLVELVVILHRIFRWSPMRLWVMIVLGIVSILSLLGSLIASKD